MRLWYVLILAMLISACRGKKKEEETTLLNDSRQVVLEDIQVILDSSHVKGSVLLYDPQSDVYYSNDFEWAEKGKLPASTFKIPNSIIALETGIVQDENTILKWDGAKRNLQLWEQDLSFRDAFQYSCVPCYQEIARKIGEKKMREFLTKLDHLGK